MSRRRILRPALTGLVFLLLLIPAALLLQGTSGADRQTPRAILDPRIEPIQGALAPDFTLRNTQGESVSLNDFRGQPVVLNFWATWCGPCRIEMPTLESRFERFGEQGLVILAVNFDEPKERVRTYGEEFGLTFPLLLDPGAVVQRLYLNRSYPTSFFVDPDGVIQVQQIGVMTEGQLDQHLEQIGLTS